MTMKKTINSKTLNQLVEQRVQQILNEKKDVWDTYPSPSEKTSETSLWDSRHNGINIQTKLRRIILKSLNELEEDLFNMDEDEQNIYDAWDEFVRKCEYTLGLTKSQNSLAFSLQRDKERNIR